MHCSCYACNDYRNGYQTYGFDHIYIWSFSPHSFYLMLFHKHVLFQRTASSTTLHRTVYLHSNGTLIHQIVFILIFKSVFIFINSKLIILVHYWPVHIEPLPKTWSFNTKRLGYTWIIRYRIVKYGNHVNTRNNMYHTTIKVNKAHLKYFTRLKAPF